MKQGPWRWAACSAAMVLALPAPALALSVGDMRARSQVGEPLRLELTLTDLRGVPASEISVSLAWAEDHQRLGVPYPEWGEQLRSVLVPEAGDRATLYLTSPQRMTGPGVTMLLRIVWPGHLSLQQVYVTLPEPERARPAPPVALPAPAPAVAPAAMPVTAPASGPAPEPAAAKPNYYLPDPAWVPYQPRPEPEPVTAEATAAPEPATIIPAAPTRTARPASPPRSQPQPPVAAIPGPQVRVKRGDTLSQLAQGWSAPGLSLARRQQLIAENNPHAFIGGDRNRLRADVLLTLPEPDLPPPEATERALSRPAEVAPPPVALAPSGRPEMRLTLVAPGQEGSLSAATPAAAGALGGQQPGQALAATEARRHDLLGQRDQLRQRLQTLDARSAEQDRRLHVLDARLASFGQEPAAAKPALVESRTRQEVLIGGGGILLLAVLLALFIFRRARGRPDSLLDKG